MAPAVTVTVVRSVAHPVWHFAHAPGTVMVGVALQHVSLGGTVIVVVERRMHNGTGPQVAGLKVFVPEHAIVLSV